MWFKVMLTVCFRTSDVVSNYVHVTVMGNLQVRLFKADVSEQPETGGCTFEDRNLQNNNK